MKKIIIMFIFMMTGIWGLNLNFGVDSPSSNSPLLRILGGILFGIWMGILATKLFFGFPKSK